MMIHCTKYLCIYQNHVYLAVQMFPHSHFLMPPDLEHPPIFLLSSKMPNTKSGSIDSALHCLFWTLLIFQLRLSKDQSAEGYIAYCKQTHFPEPSAPRSPTLQKCNLILKFIHRCLSARNSTCVQAKLRLELRALGSSSRRRRLRGLLSSLARASKAAPHLMSSCQFFRPLYLVLRFSWQTAEEAVCY